MKNILCNYWWFIIALIIALIVQLYWFSSLTLSDLDSFFTSDTLTLPSLYRDWFEDGYTMNGWTLNAAPNFFPDMLLFFILNFITGSFVSAAFWFSIIQFFAIIIICYLLFKTIKSNLLPTTFVPAIFLCTSFLFVLFIDHVFWESMLINTNSFHNGAFVMTLACLLSFFLYLKKESKISLILFLVIVVISAPSDRLFFISLVVPLFLTMMVLFLLKFERKKIKKTGLFLLIGAVAGFGVWWSLKHNSTFALARSYGEITSENIQSSWSILWTQMYMYLTDRQIFSFLIILCLITYLGSIHYIVLKLTKKQEKNLIFAFQIFVLFFTPIVFLAPVFAGSYGGFDTFRYNFFPFILLPFNSILLVSHFLDKNRISRFVVNLVPASLIIIFFAAHLPKHSFVKGFEQYFSFYPIITQTFDDYFAGADSITYCVSNNYWLTKKITMFSKTKMRVYTMNGNSAPWLHAINKHWLIDSDKGKYAHCQFTYLIWHKDADLPDFFKNANPDSRPISLGGYHLYKVAPFRFNEKDWWTPILINTSD